MDMQKTRKIFKVYTTVLWYLTMNKTDLRSLFFRSILHKKRKRKEKIPRNGESVPKKRFGKTCSNLFRSTSVSRDSFSFFFIFTSKRWKNRSEGLRGAACCETGAQKRSFTRGNDAREKEKKKWGGGGGGRWRSERGFNEAGAHPMALMTLINCTKDGDQPLCTSHGNTSETSRKFC